MADISEAFKRACKTFKILKLSPHQQDAIMQIADLFIKLPTGFGKSLIYQALPLTFDIIRGTLGHSIGNKQ